MEEFYPDDRQWARKTRGSRNKILFVCHMVNDKRDAPVLEELEPDLSFGEIFEGTGKVPCIVLFI